MSLNDFNPTEELLKMLPIMDDEQKIRALCFLITYSQPKPAESTKQTDERPNIPLSTEEILEVVRHQLTYKDKK